jgi:hypothetical protein
MKPASTRLYWFCGGEIMTRGGPLHLSSSRTDGSGSPGCRPLSLQRASELWGFYALRGRACRDACARRHCEACAEELREAIMEAMRWRCAA